MGIQKLLQEFSAFQRKDWADVSSDNALTFPALAAALSKYQDPREADKVLKIQEDLEETKQILYKTIEQTLDRGQRLDDLIDKRRTYRCKQKRFTKPQRNIIS